MAFEECVSLDEITIPRSIVLGKGVFCNCTALKTVIFEADPELSKIPGILIALSTLHPLNALTPIELNVSGKRISFKFLQFSKVLVSIL